MYLLKNKDLLDEIETNETEFLLTNGIGGYASSTITETHTRKYHGVLVASLNPPVQRFMTVSKMVDSLTCQGGCLKSFKKDAGAHWHYETNEGLELKKSLYLIQGENTALLTYELKSEQDGSIKLCPQLSIRDHHEVSYLSDVVPVWTLENQEALEGHTAKSNLPMRQIQIKHENLPNGLKIELRTINDCRNNPSLNPLNQWVGPYPLANEIERGLEKETMAFEPFEWVIPYKAGEVTRFNVLISTEAQLPQQTAEALIQGVWAHYEHLLALGQMRGNALPHRLKGLQEKLLISASDFVVKRKSTGKSTILAGYPWFTDWGRDSMISLSGLTLSAGRKDQFREIYEAFEGYMKNGILPNVFPDEGDEPRYNTVDATLWMSIAMWRYYEETKDLAYVKKHFLTTIESVISHYQKGTLNKTYMDEDGLICSGDASTQLTWMDVKVNGWVVTPRHGKAVEINALWYNTLMIGQYFKELVEDKTHNWSDLANQVRESFEKVFWNESVGYCNDVVREDETLTCIRPNQIFALSLPFPLLEGEKAQKVLAVVKEHLLIPYGLRSLSPSDIDYQGYYGGDVLARDGAYHRGTGWGWLIGPYLDALYYVKSAKAKEGQTPNQPQTEQSLQTSNEQFPNESLQNVMETLILRAGEHLDEICLGQFSENFDGDAPHHARGCMAQAWSVAEMLRWIDKINTFKTRRLTK